jgi:hypothetical protein
LDLNGLNYANYSGSDLQFDAPQATTALVAEIKLVDSFSIQPELYSTQGAT